MLKRFLTDDSGATAIEYSLIIAVVSLAILGGLGQVMNAIHDNFNYVSDLVTDSAEQ